MAGQESYYINAIFDNRDSVLAAVSSVDTLRLSVSYGL